MKNLTKKLLFLSLVLCLSFACDSVSPEIPSGEFEDGVLIVNEGAFGANDGEIYHFDPETGNIQSDIFELKNNRPFAGLIQNMYIIADRSYLVANTGKVEVVNSADFTSRGAVSGEDLENSRSLTVFSEKLFISDWGPYDENWENPDSFIAVVQDLDGGPVDNKIEVPSRPEGMTVYNDKILVACQGESLMAVINPEEESVDRTIEVEGTPFSFFIYGGQLYLYALGEDEILVHPISAADFSMDETLAFRVSEPIYNGNYVLGNDGEMYVISGNGASTVVVKLSIVSGEILDETFFAGNNFYGLGFHHETNTLYIGEHNGWQGNGNVIRVNATGDELESIPAGRGPSGFLFP
ncbi:MAG: DUF5074 domain-containing protein [Cyclobacteriaceae bacterium]